MRTELWLTEGAEISVLCRDPAELLNALSRENIRVSDVKDWGEQRFRFSVSAGDLETLRRLAGRCGVEIAEVRRRGSRHFLRRFRKRTFLLFVPLLFLFFFLWLSTFLWEIRVSGNVTLNSSEILAALESVGVYPGVSGLRLDNPQIRSRMQSLLPELIWCTVQVRGSRAVVVVRERRLPPEPVDESLERDVAAAKAGTVESLQVLQGKAVVRRGDTVLPGEMLITGTLADRQDEYRHVHAQGRVIARTWYEKTAEIPLTVWEKAETGVEKSRWGIKIGDLTLKMGREGSISLDFYDKICNAEQVSVLGLGLPLFVLRQETKGYALRERPIRPDEAEALLKERLLAWLRGSVPEAELLRADFRTEVTERSVRVTMLAACREDIGVESPPVK